MSFLIYVFIYILENNLLLIHFYILIRFRKLLDLI